MLEQTAGQSFSPSALYIIKLFKILQPAISYLTPIHVTEINWMQFNLLVMEEVKFESKSDVMYTGPYKGLTGRYMPFGV